MSPDLEHVAQLLEAFGAEMRTGFSELKGRLADSIARFDRQEHVDRLWEEHIEHVRQLEERVRRLEENH